MNDPANIKLSFEDMLEWLRSYREKNSLSWTALAKRMNKPSGSVSSWATASFQGNRENVAKTIFAFKQLVESQEARAELALNEVSFIETKTADRLLFLMEWMTRGAFIDDAVDGMGGTDNMSASFSHRQMATLALLTEISLWGPRITLTAIKRLSGATRLGLNPQPDAAAVLAVLLRREDGTASATVLTVTGLTAERFGDALAYLTFHEWIDISKDGLYLWILSDARKRLK